eukprot:767704-Hanusia_phi.AAC.4
MNTTPPFFACMAKYFNDRGRHAGKRGKGGGQGPEETARKECEVSVPPAPSSRTPSPAAVHARTPSALQGRGLLSGRSVP